MKKIFSGRFDYPGYTDPASCLLDIYEHETFGHIVLATELADNPGTSVTNAIEIIASLAVVRHQLDPERVVVIEHYGPESYTDGDREPSYDLVEMPYMPGGSRQFYMREEALFGRPTWTHLGSTWEQAVVRLEARLGMAAREVPTVMRQ